MKPYETTTGTPTRADGSTPFTHHKPVEYRECDCPQCLASRQDAEDRMVDNAREWGLK